MNLPRRDVLAGGLSIGLALLMGVPVWAQAPELPAADDALRSFGLQTAEPRPAAPVVTAVAINADGTLLATGGDDHLVNIWNIDDGKLRHTLRGHAEWVRAVIFSPDGKTLATAGDDRTIKLWDAATGQLIRDFWQDGTTTSWGATKSRQRTAAIYALTFSPDGQQIAAAGFENSVGVYDVQTGRGTRSLRCSCNDIRALAFSTDGTQLVAGGRDGKIRVWNTADARVLHDWEGHGQRIRALAFSPEADKLASAGEDRHICIWDVANGQHVAIASGDAKVMALCFCGAGHLASGGSDNLVRVWDLNTRQSAASFAGHTGSVAALASDPGAKLLVSGSFDTTVRLWQLDRLKGQQALRLDEKIHSR